MGRFHKISSKENTVRKILEKSLSVCLHRFYLMKFYEKDPSLSQTTFCDKKKTILPNPLI